MSNPEPEPEPTTEDTWDGDAWDRDERRSHDRRADDPMLVAIARVHKSIGQHAAATSRLADALVASVSKSGRAIRIWLAVISIGIIVVGFYAVTNRNLYVEAEDRNAALQEQTKALQTQTSRLEAQLVEQKRLNDIIVDCTTPEGECSKKSQAQLAAGIGQIDQIVKGAADQTVCDLGGFCAPGVVRRR